MRAAFISLAMASIAIGLITGCVRGPMPPLTLAGRSYSIGEVYEVKKPTRIAGVLDGKRVTVHSISPSDYETHLPVIPEPFRVAVTDIVQTWEFGMGGWYQKVTFTALDGPLMGRKLDMNTISIRIQEPRKTIYYQANPAIMRRL